MRAIISLIQVLIWPAVLLFILIYFRPSLSGFLTNLGELNFSGFGLQATLKREQVAQAAAWLGAAQAQRTNDSPQQSQEKVRQAANVVSEAVAQQSPQRLREALVLWVDDNPSNNVLEIRSLEALGVRTITSTSTEDALQKVGTTQFDVIISDMGRPPDPRAGYTLLE